jgi:hypothetical protein
MPRQALVRTFKDSPPSGVSPASAPVQVKGPSLGETLVHSVASGAGSGIGFSVVNSFFRSQTGSPTAPELCDIYEHDFRKCLIERDDESCSKLWSVYTKNGHKICVQSANK